MDVTLLLSIQINRNGYFSFMHCRESEATNLLAKRPQVSEASLKETSTVMECFTPEGKGSVSSV